MLQNTTNMHCWKFGPQSCCKQLTLTGISSSWFAASAVKTYDISLWDVVCLQMAHLMELRRVPMLYCWMMIAMHSLQKQCPHVSTAHYAGNKKTQTQHRFSFGPVQKKNSVLIYDKVRFHREITLSSRYSSDQRRMLQFSHSSC